MKFLIIATLAPLLSSIQLLPQLYKTYTTKSVHDISIYSLLLIFITNLAWFAHGYFIFDYSLLISGIVNILINIFLIILFYVYSKMDTTQ